MTRNDFLEPEEFVWPTTFDKNAILHVDPQYTDPRFDKEQSIFGKPSKYLNYEYSDRLWEWDYNKAEKAGKHATSLGITRKTCAWYEAYLSFYYDKPIEIKNIIAGVNKSNGYSYLVFGF